LDVMQASTMATSSSSTDVWSHRASARPMPMAALRIPAARSLFASTSIPRHPGRLCVTVAISAARASSATT
jgi:hypothetical protein